MNPASGPPAASVESEVHDVRSKLGSDPGGHTTHCVWSGLGIESDGQN